MDTLDVSALDRVREEVSTLGLHHGLERRWAVIDMGAAQNSRPRPRGLAYRLDADRIAVLRPDHFQDLPEGRAAALLEAELAHIGRIVSTERRRALRRQVLLEAIATPLPAA